MSNQFDDKVTAYYQDHDTEILEDYFDKFPDILPKWLIERGGRELWDKLMEAFLNDYKSKEMDIFGQWADSYIRAMLESSDYHDKLDDK